MDASPITLGILGAGVLLAWSAIANRNPIDEVKAAFGVKVDPRPLASPTRRPQVAYGGPALGTADGGAGFGGARSLRTWMDIVAIVPWAKVGSTTGGTHVAGSKHYQNKAVDFPGSAGSTVPDHELNRVWDALLPYAQSGALAELYYDPRGGWKNGRSIGAIGGHGGHLHAATP